MTAGQSRAHASLWEKFGLPLPAETDFQQAFGRVAPLILEIGFGTGHSLLAAAIAHPELNFAGVETHLPGIGSLLAGIEQAGVTNLRIFHADAVNVLDSLPAASLQGIQVFFPDPWPKRRHHKRRLIQPDFVGRLVQVLVTGGTLHLATDWEDYAIQMMQVCSGFPQLENLAGPGQYADRSEGRLLVTRFEARAFQAGRVVRELQFVKKQAPG